MENINKVIQSIQEAQKELELKITNIVKPYIKQLFKDVPELKAIQWVQFTPHFNDGDECIFSVESPSFFIDPEILDIYEDEIDFADFNPSDLREFDDCDHNSFKQPWFYSYRNENASKFEEYQKRYSKENSRYERLVSVIGTKRLQEIESVLLAFSSNVDVLEDGFRTAFGEHSMVTVVREGEEIDITVDDYDHD
jgi:hypothetical protein